MAGKNKYSVGQLSKLSGVSVRALHLYDEKNLLKAKRDVNGYRFYSSYDAALLQQIIIYRQMDISLDDIFTIVHAENFDLLSALEKQRELLIQRRDNTDEMINRLEVTIKMAKGEENLDALLAKMPQAKVQEWKSELKQDDSSEKIFEAYGKLSNDDIQATDEWNERYMRHTHLPVSDDKIQELMKEAYIITNRLNYKTLDDFSGTDYGFLKYIIEAGRKGSLVVDIYETYQKGMAKHYFDALDYFAEHLLKDNEDKYINLV